jgi:hypothetical protein
MACLPRITSSGCFDHALEQPGHRERLDGGPLRHLDQHATVDRLAHDLISLRSGRFSRGIDRHQHGQTMDSAGLKPQAVQERFRDLPSLVPSAEEPTVAFVQKLMPEEIESAASCWRNISARFSRCFDALDGAGEGQHRPPGAGQRAAQEQDQAAGAHRASDPRRSAAAEGFDARGQSSMPIDGSTLRRLLPRSLSAIPSFEQQIRQRLEHGGCNTISLTHRAAGHHEEDTEVLQSRGSIEWSIARWIAPIRQVPPRCR